MHFYADAKSFAIEMLEAMKFSSEKGITYQKAVLLTLKENSLEFRTRTYATAPYREMAFCSTLAVDGRKDGQIAVPSRMITDIISGFDKGIAEFKATEKNLLIKQDGKHYQIKLLELDPKTMDFAIPDDDDFSPLSDDFCKAIEKVSYATQKNDAREILRSVFFEYTDEKLHIVSTDGRRISSMSLHEKGKGKTLLPVEFASMMGKRNAEGIVTEDKRVIFKKEHRYYISSIYTAEYPNWKKVMPPKIDCEKAEVNRVALADAIKRMSLTSDKDSHRIKIKVEDNQMTITSLSKEGEGREVVSCTSSTPFEKSFRFNFLADVLKVSTSENLTIHYGKNDNRPILITDDDPCFRAAVCDMGDAQ